MTTDTNGTTNVLVHPTTTQYNTLTTPGHQSPDTVLRTYNMPHTCSSRNAFPKILRRIQGCTQPQPVLTVAATNHNPHSWAPLRHQCHWRQLI
jgi:hypothetical protein